MPGLVKRISHARYKTGTASVIEDMVTVMAHSETTCPRANPIIIAVCKYLVWGEDVSLGSPQCKNKDRRIDLLLVLEFISDIMCKRYLLRRHASKGP